ncbi:glycosyltransferase 87 family protein [Candidatus Protofrankia californiensis]|uniref:glycosyltransferase 87 family protein n=1 Tax=Candidatus Protofrankia californiensis TaxID=1839754 RepID=UPI0010413250|nr:glycosyltransferase 87 family protein [Candidatus Protofrankia californiensis]
MPHTLRAPLAPPVTRLVPAPRPGRAARPRATLVAAVVGLVGILAVQAVTLFQPGYLPDRAGVLYLAMLWWALGMTTATLLLHAAPRRLAVGLLLAGTVTIHAVALTHGPQLSDDLYRYVWDGRVQATGIDPYHYGPLDPELAHLRDRWLFPDPGGCAAIERGPGCIRLNYPRAHTIYPPVAQAYFTAVHLLPGPPREHKTQLYTSLASLALVALIMTMLTVRGRDPRYAGFYALSPLAGLDVASDAHVDVLAALLALGGIAVLTSRPRTRSAPAGRPTRRRTWIAGTLLAAAVAVKLYPALLLPAAARRRPVVVVGAAVAVVGLSYLPHVLAVGTGALGFLPEYLNVEGYGQGDRFLLLTALGINGAAAKAAAVSVLAAVTAAVMRSEPSRVPVERAALWLVGAAFLVATPVQPWYGILLVALAILAGRLEWLAVAAAGHPVYVSLFTDLPGDARTLRVSSYTVAALVVLSATLLRQRQRDTRPLHISAGE